MSKWTRCVECGALLDYDGENVMYTFSYGKCEVRFSNLGTVSVTPASREIVVLLGALMRMTQEPTDGPAGLSSTIARGYGCEHTGIWSWRWTREDERLDTETWSKRCFDAVELLDEGSWKHE